MDASYLLDAKEAGSREWLGKWDARMLAILRAADDEGLFYIEVNAYKANSSGGYVKDAENGNFRAYVAATDSALTRYEKMFENENAVLSIANDGILMMTVSGEDPTTALFDVGTYEKINNDNENI